MKHTGAIQFWKSNAVVNIHHNKKCHQLTIPITGQAGLVLHFFRCINPFPNKPWFLAVCSTSLLKTLWNNVFYLFAGLFMKVEIIVCKLFEFGRV